MEEHSRMNRTEFSELANIRDEQNEDDDEFFAGADEPENGGEEEGNENEEPVVLKNDESERRIRRREFDDFGVGTGSKIRSEVQINQTNFPTSASFGLNSSTLMNQSSNTGQATFISPASTSALSSAVIPNRRYETNLTRITEMPDEFSFSFKHGESALEAINENHEQNNMENHLRLPSGTFHPSQYSLKYSWEESALCYQNSITRSELDLTHVQVQPKKDTSQRESFSEGATTAYHLISIKQKEKNVPNNSSLANSTKYSKQKNSTAISLQADKTNQSSLNKTGLAASKSPPFISSNRYAIYFGFRRFGVDSEEILNLHNIHPNKETLQIKCKIKGKGNDENGASKCFKIVQPQTSSILKWNSYQKIFITFTPTTVDHSINYLFVECQSTITKHVAQKFLFPLHGFGGSALVQPTLNDKSRSSLFLSANGHHQLMVNSLSKFRFWLHNRGDRRAFASIFLYGRRGELLTHGESFMNTRNVILDKNGQNNSKRQIEIRYPNRPNQLTPRPSSQSSVALTSTGLTFREEPAVQMIIFWGEEHQRQRLKQFEEKQNIKLETFGKNFTKSLDFWGEDEHQGQKSAERLISEEEFYNFDRSVKLIIIDVHEKKHFERGITPISSANSTNTGQWQQRRVGSTLSVESLTGGRRDICRGDQVVVEVDPDNTLLQGAYPTNDGDGDDTLI